MTKYQDPSDYWWDKTTNSMRGDFESMYVDIADPWDCNANVDSLPNDLLLALLKRFGPVKRLLDVGCGAGALTDRLHRELTRPTGGGAASLSAVTSQPPRSGARRLTTAVPS